MSWRSSWKVLRTAVWNFSIRHGPRVWNKPLRLAADLISVAFSGLPQSITATEVPDSPAFSIHLK